MEQIIYAGNRGGCGLASLKMLLVYLQKDRNYQYFKETGDKSLEDLRFIAEKEGVNLVWKKVNNKKSIEENKVFPLLLLFEGKKENHLVYLKKRKKKGFVILDPDIGETSLSMQDLQTKWTGIYGEGTLIEKKRSNNRKERYISLKGLISTSLFFLLSIASFFFSFFFFEGQMPVYLTILFLAISFVFLLLEKEAIRVEMRRFDKSFLPSFFRRKGATKEEYAHYLSFKKVLFLRLRALIEAPLCLIGTLLVFGLNSPSFLIAALLLLLESTLSLLVFKPMSLQEKSELSKEEEDVFGGKGGVEKKKSFEKYENYMVKIEKTSRKVEYRSLFNVIFAFLFSFLPVIFEKRIETNFFLFEFFALMALLEAYNPLLGLLENEEERKKEEAFFRENFEREV